MNFTGINKLLIIRLSSLGDILLTTPLIRSLKKKNPAIKIDYILREQYKNVIEHNPYINKVIVYSETGSLNESLKEGKYDAVVDLQNNIRSSRLRKAAGAPAFKFKKRSVDKFLLVNFKINNLRDTPPVPQRYAESLPEFDLDNDGLDLFLPGSISSPVEQGDSNIGLAPGSRHFTKMWPKDYYIELGRMLTAAGYNVYLLGGKSDRTICKELEGSISGSVDLSNDDDLFLTAASMKNCSAIVCNDSGLMHTACAVKTPVLVFFGSTVKEFGFTPYKNKNLILENKLLSCRPCSHIGRESCPKGHFRCMLELTPQKAFDNLLNLLKA